jgi:O-antigen/teichoic acid export membrane protein
MLKSTSSDSVDDFLKKIISSSFLIFFGNIASMVATFGIGILLIRTVDQKDFGIIALANTIITIVVIISTMGFGNGIPRLLAKYQEHNDQTKAQQIIATSQLLCLFTSIIIVCLLYFFSGEMAVYFHKPRLEFIGRIFVLMIPPLIFIQLTTANFRGLKKTLPKIIFRDIFFNFSRFFLLVVIYFMGLDVFAVAWGYVAVTWFVCLCYLLYFYKTIKFDTLLFFNPSVARELLLFSIPLLGVVLLDNIVNWVGTLSVGYFSSSVEIGIYAASQRLTPILKMPFTAVLYIYLPLATSMVVKHQFSEMKILHSSACKWIFISTLPLLLFFLADADFIVNKLFGENYSATATILRLITIGIFFQCFLGPSGITIIAFGKTSPVLTTSAAACCIAVLLNVLFVPLYGALGAAISMATAKIISCVLLAFSLYCHAKLHVFNKHQIFMLIFSFPIGLGLFYFLNIIPHENWLGHLVMIPFVFTILLIITIVCKTFSLEDVHLLGTIENKITGKQRFSNWMMTRI